MPKTPSQAGGSRVFQVDIHPAVPIGGCIFFDQVTGIVVDETAVIEDNVSIPQNVTLSGTGKHTGGLAPQGQAVLFGAATIVPGNIEIGANARIGAGSAVLKSVDPGTAVAGVPVARLGSAGAAKSSHVMH
jgi:serine O-acetyltransferase